MPQVNVRVPEPLHKAMKAVSKETGAPYAELVRRALAAFLETRKGKAA